MSDARGQMIEAAERIGAEQGLAAMSLRAVQAAAGQRNKSAAQYHFGTREGLVAAVVATRMGPINERRAEALAVLPPDADLRSLVDVLVRPVAQAVLHPPSWWARFVLQGSTDPTIADVVRTTMEGHAFRETCSRIVARLLPDLPPPLAQRRLDHTLGLVFVSLAAMEGTPPDARRDVLPDAAAVEDLIDLCLGVLTAPVSGATTAALGDRPTTSRESSR